MKIFLMSVTLFFLVSSSLAQNSESGFSPVTVVGKVNIRNLTQGIPITTIFTPTTTGVFRASTYLAMTSPATGGNAWYALLYWTDDAGPEYYELSNVPDNNAPPGDYGYTTAGGLNPPFTFEAIAGQAVSFSLVPSPDAPPGTCGLTITIERLQ